MSGFSYRSIIKATIQSSSNTQIHLAQNQDKNKSKRDALNAWNLIRDYNAYDAAFARLQEVKQDHLDAFHLQSYYVSNALCCEWRGKLETAIKYFDLAWKLMKKRFDGTSDDLVTKPYQKFTHCYNKWHGALACLGENNYDEARSLLNQLKKHYVVPNSPFYFTVKKLLKSCDDNLQLIASQKPQNNQNLIKVYQP